MAVFSQVRNCSDNFTFQEYICQVFQKPEENFRNMNFRILLILHDYANADQSDQVRKPKNYHFLQTWFENISENFWLQSSKLFWPLSFTRPIVFSKQKARQRKFSMYWKSFLRSERLGQALFLPSLRATSILSSSLVAARSLSQQKCLFCSRIWITLDNFSTAVVPSAVPHMFWMAYR